MYIAPSAPHIGSHNGTKGARPSGVKRRPGCHRRPEFRDSARFPVKADYDSMPSAVTIPAVRIPELAELAVHVHQGGVVTRTSTRACALAELQAELARAELG